MYLERAITTYSNGYTTSSTDAWQWQKWSLFAILIVLLILVLVATLRANLNRIRNGRQPIRGTAWFTPPSYQQSERQYNHDDGMHVNRHNNRRQQEENIPKYTPEVGEEDLGFYDTDGKFHQNVKGQMKNPPAFDTGVVTTVENNTAHNGYYPESDSESIFGVERPDHTVSRQRIREYYNNNFNHVEMDHGSSSNNESSNAHELQNVNTVANNTNNNSNSNNNNTNTTHTNTTN